MSLSLEEQYTLLRSGCGLVALDDWGRLEIRGQDRLTHLHNYTTASVSDLAPPGGVFAAVTTVKGRVLDHVQILALEDRLLVLTSPGTSEKLQTFLERYVLNAEVEITDLAARTRLWALVGPHSRQILDGLGFGAIARDGYALASMDGHPILAACNLLGYRLLATPEAEPSLTAALQAKRAVPVDAPALEALRVAQGIPAYGQEISEDTNPWEPRLDRSISLSKGCYLGQEVIARLQAYDKIQRRLVGMRLSGIPAKLPCELVPSDDPTHAPVGLLTSAVLIPGSGLLGLALVKTDWTRPGTRLKQAGDGGVHGTTIDLPFWSSQEPS